MIQKIFFRIIKINNFRGELTDNSDKKEALTGTRQTCICSVEGKPWTKGAWAGAEVGDSASFLAEISIRSSHFFYYYYYYLKKICSGSKYPKKNSFNFEKNSTGWRWSRSLEANHELSVQVSLNMVPLVCSTSFAVFLDCFIIVCKSWQHGKCCYICLDSSDLICISALSLPSRPVLPFAKLNKIFFGYFDPENII